MTNKHTPIHRDKLEQEKRWVNIVAYLSSVSILSGILLASPYFSYWLQLNLIGHIIIGTVCFLPACMYCFIHFKRTLGIRSATLIFSGLLACVLLLLLFFSGFWIAIKGQTERLFWVSSAHAIIAYACIIIVVIHIISHIQHKRQKSKDRTNDIFITISLVLGNKVFLFSVIYILAISLFYLSYIIFNKHTPDAVKENYLFSYGDHPFRPSQTETASNGFIKNEQIAKSQQCGSCHTDIYQQWLSSTHRQATSDPAYVKNISLLEKNRGIAATRYCEGCHAPVALLTGELTPGGKHGGIPDTPAHLEGVGCMSCHGISKVLHLNGTASYEFDPKEHYLFDSHAKLVPQVVRNFLIRSNPDSHKKAMNSDLMQDPKLCASCHEQFMDKSMNNWGWVKMQSEYTNWLSSPFSGQNEQNFQNDTALTCQNCHFPLVQGNDPSANKQGLIHSHRSLGANTVLPLLNNDKEQLDATKRFLQTAKVLVDIEEPSRKDNIQNKQFVNTELRPNNQDNTPFFLYLGEQFSLRVTVTNRMVGHTFPAGTTDINQAWLHFRVSDADDKTVYESGFLNSDLTLDSNAHIYHSIPVDKKGKEIWKHDLFRMTGDAYKNLIAPGKSDIKEYLFEVPSWAKEPLTATAIIKYRKFNQRYAQWALDHPRPELPIVDMARDSLTIPLKIKPVINNKP